RRRQSITASRSGSPTIAYPRFPTRETEPLPAPPRAAPQPALMTNTGMRILGLESAVRDIDAFAKRHRNLGSDATWSASCICV
ncbi:MAG: hypothetical protein WB611_09995, partial [Stellaceae bacterium]